MRKCSTCGVPIKLTRELEWSDKGTLQQRKQYANRMVFYKSDNIDSLFSEIERLIGISVERIVVERKRRDTGEFVEEMMPVWLRRMMRKKGMSIMVKQMLHTGTMFGFGRIRLAAKRVKLDDDDFISVDVENPHSLLFFCGEVLGAWEAVQGRESQIDYEDLGGNTYRLTCHIGKHPIELKERLTDIEYPESPVDFTWERCPACGTPMEVSRYNWDLDKGIITSLDTGRRMSMIRPDGIDSIMRDLETELGEEIRDTTVKAQKIYTKKALSDLEYRQDIDGFRRMLAFRGLGYLSEMDLSERGLRVVLKNYCMPLIMTGILQAFYELNIGTEETSYNWSESQGDLIIEISR
ncbi:MAG: hypothetical protein SWK76_01315 [Actinomycetota bacterium]|nr:hypothetical protein [Actinomycetota bacterium]